MSKHVYSLPQYIEQWSFCLRKMYIKNSLSIQLRHSLVVSGCPLHFARILSSVNFGSKCLQVHYIPGGRSWHCRYVAWHKSQALPSPRQPALKQHPRHPKHRRRRRPPGRHWPRPLSALSFPAPNAARFQHMPSSQSGGRELGGQCIFQTNLIQALRKLRLQVPIAKCQPLPWHLGRQVLFCWAAPICKSHPPVGSWNPWMPLTRHERLS